MEQRRGSPGLLAVALAATASALLNGCAAQQRSEMASCANNLKQLGTAYIAYSQDYDEKLPPALRHNPPVAWNEMLYVYLKSQQVFICPEDSSRNIPWGNPATNFHTSYMANHQLFSKSDHPVNISEITAPANTVLMCDGGMQAGSGNPPLPGGVTATSTIKEGCWILQDPASRARGGEPELARSNQDQNWGGPNLRHNDHSLLNTLYADGHVKATTAAWYYNNTPWLDPARGGQ